MADLCVGCGICLGLCPVNAISLKKSSTLTVDFNHVRCIGCNLCVRLCPALSNLYRKKPTSADAIGKIEKAFYGYSKDFRIRYGGASGGVVTSILISMIKNDIVDKALVTRIEGLIPAPLLTDNEKEILSTQGAIYFKTFSLRIAKQILCLLENGERICIVGLPCQISALKRNFRKYRKSLFFVGLICNHVNELWYMSYILNEYLPRGAKLITIKPRKDGRPGKIKISYQSNNSLQEVAIPQHRFWNVIPQLALSSPLGCLVCTEHLAPNADIVVGDVWHPKYSKDSVGISTIIVRTSEGSKMINDAANNNAIFVEEAKSQDMLIAHGSHVIESIEYAPLRQAILNCDVKLLKEFKHLDKIAVFLLTMLNQFTSRSERSRLLFNARLTKKILELVSRFVSRSKSIRLRTRTGIVWMALDEHRGRNDM
jgi:coenzyme F420 hydrogenase subunit beta